MVIWEARVRITSKAEFFFSGFFCHFWNCSLLARGIVLLIHSAGKLKFRFLKYDFGPVQLAGLLRNGPQFSNEFRLARLWQTWHTGPTFCLNSDWLVVVHAYSDPTFCLSPDWLVVARARVCCEAVNRDVNVTFSRISRALLQRGSASLYLPLLP